MDAQTGAVGCRFDTMLQIRSGFDGLAVPELTPCRFALSIQIMHLIRFVVPILLASGTTLSQSGPARGDAGPTESSAGVAAAKRRSELKAVLKAEIPANPRPGEGLDAAERQQLRKQLKEQPAR